jgi:hypothetical protein
MELIATADCARILGITPSGVQWLCRVDQLSPVAVLPSGQRLFLRAAVDELARRRRRHQLEHQEVAERGPAEQADCT